MIRIAEYFKPQPRPFWAIVKQVGVDLVVSELDRSPEAIHDNTGEQPWDYVPLARMKERYESAGLEIAGIEDWPPMDRARLGLSGRDEEIEAVCTLIRNMGRLGIPMLCYNWMAVLNWSRTRTMVRGRGGALVSAFDSSDLRDAPPTWAGAVPHEQLWSAFDYFLRKVVPVAEDAGVRLALHPDDPPIPELRGVGRIMTSLDAFRRALSVVDSPANSLCLCQGNFTLFTDDVPEAIREFGSRERIAFGHFRDVRGTADSFVETFHDDGQTDMAECMAAWQEIPFDGVLRPDHVPTLEGEANDDPGYAFLARLFAIGYMVGLQDGTSLGQGVR